MNLEANQSQIVNAKPHLGGRRRTMKRRMDTGIPGTGIPGRGSFLRGWKKAQPGYHDRTTMMNRCGRRCFLGPNRSFPICRRNTCKKDRRGIYAAYIRAREYQTIKGTPKYKNISAKARRLLKIF